SPFAPFLRTNYAPTLAELSDIKATLVEPQHELGRLQSEINHVQCLLDNLLREKTRVETYIEAHKALMSPIRQISVEILAEIFLFCMPVETMPYMVRSLKYAPLLLNTVCRHWRNTALNTPALWSSLHIRFPSYLGGDVVSQRFVGMRLWLERAGTFPISLSL
ncbi:hypothetical protein BDP27DRAFT_1200301, partial [Rhodocollybia butyracea]